MKWIKNFFKKDEEPLVVEEGEAEAKKIGRDLVEGMMSALDAIFEARYGDLKERYLEVLALGLRESMIQNEHSPALKARAELGIFLENLTDKKSIMLKDVMSYMKKWQDVFYEVGEPDIIINAANERVNDLISSIKISGISLMEKHLDAIIIADKSWRKNHPELAEEQPL